MMKCTATPHASQGRKKQTICGNVVLASDGWMEFTGDQFRDTKMYKLNMTAENVSVFLLLIRQVRINCLLSFFR